MLRIRLKYLSIFLGIISLLSFLNVLYSYYFNLYLNLNTYFYTLLISGLFSLIFFKFSHNKSRPSLFEKIVPTFLLHLIHFSCGLVLFFIAFRFDCIFFSS